MFAAMKSDGCRQCWLHALMLKPQDGGTMISGLHAEHTLLPALHYWLGQPLRGSAQHRANLPSPTPSF